MTATAVGGTVASTPAGTGFSFGVSVTATLSTNDLGQPAAPPGPNPDGSLNGTGLPGDPNTKTD